MSNKIDILEQLYRYYNNLLRQTDGTFYRSMYADINWSQRMMAIKGARGVGKTTMLLQHLKFGLPSDIPALYVTADHVWFYQNSLIDLAEAFVSDGGRYLAIDEVHKYPHWSRELKNIHDGYPQLQIVFTASSALDIQRGEADLSRRLITYELPGMSFREYVQLYHQISVPKLTLEDILQHHASISKDLAAQFDISVLFRQYLRNGYYPFGIRETEDDYFKKMNQVINAVIESDLAGIEGFQSGSVIKIKKLLGVVAESVPFQPNIASISRKLDISRDYVYAFLNQLQRARMLNFISAEGKGMSALQKPDKIFLENTNLSFALQLNPDLGNIRETFFMNQLLNAGMDIKLPAQGDFLINNTYTFEIGGRNKKHDQISDLPNAYTVHDNFDMGRGSKISLWMFGLLY